MKDKIERYHKVPDGYFSQLESDILKNKPESNNRNKVLLTLKPWLSIAATVCVLVLGGLAIISRIGDTSSETNIAEFSDVHGELEETLYSALLLDDDDEDQTLNDLAKLLSDVDMYEQ